MSLATADDFAKTDNAAVNCATYTGGKQINTGRKIAVTSVTHLLKETAGHYSVSDY